jgi:hypothetical protein
MIEEDEHENKQKRTTTKELVGARKKVFDDVRERSNSPPFPFSEISRVVLTSVVY